MVFCSLVFLFCFLPLVLIGYFLTPGVRLRNCWLLALSLVFYAYGEPVLIWVMCASMTVNSALGLLVERGRARRWGRPLLAFGIVANLSLLGYFKYAGFVVGNFNILAAWLGLPPARPMSVLLPLGISFYTFQGISYLVDVYRGDVRAARNPLHLMLYIAMFPHQLAGPIVRFRDIAGQLASRRVTPEGFRAGAIRFMLGLTKKVMLANIVAAPADAIFGQPFSELTCAVAWLGIVCYTLQIYLDFSAYSDMAIGLAAMFGITFAENFNHPYAARSVTDFWRRWHMTLSNWFRDYVYIPLGGNRKGRWRTCFNLSVVFLLCGLWHGANWTFIFWGAYHGLFLILERTGFGRFLEARHAVVRHFYALSTVAVGWVFFRAESFAQAGGFLKAMIGLGAPTESVWALDAYFDPALLAVLIMAVLVCVPWNGARLLQAGAEFIQDRTVLPRAAVLSAARLMLLAGLLTLCGTRIVGGSHNPFIYFRF